MQNRNRKAACDVCGKPMRSDNLKRHKQTHRDLLALSDNEIKNELKARQEIKERQEEKIRKIEEIARENNLVIPEEITSKKHEYDQIEDVCTRCLQNHQLYLKKIELGKQVAIIIENGEVIYELTMN